MDALDWLQTMCFDYDAKLFFEKKYCYFAIDFPKQTYFPNDAWTVFDLYENLFSDNLASYSAQKQRKAYARCD